MCLAAGGFNLDVVDTERPDPAGGDTGRDAEIEGLRRDRDELAAQVASLQSRRSRRRGLRRTAVVLLLVVGTLSFTMSATGWWARRNVANTEVWLERVGPLADDPAVRAALGTWMSDEIVRIVDPEHLFEEVLPERGQLLAGPLTGAVEGFVRDRIDRFLASDRFERLWREANELVQPAVVRVLRGEGDTVSASGDHVVINLVPVINEALADIGSASPELFGRQVNLPDLSVDDLPQDAIGRLEQALGLPLDDDFGQFVVYDGGRLEALQQGIQQARRLLVALTVLTVAAFGGALWLSDRPRRTLLQLLAGLAIGLAVIRRLGIRGQHELLDAVPNQVNRAAVEAASDRFLDPLLGGTKTVLIVLALLAAVLVVTGPYPWAARLRHGTARLARGVTDDLGRRRTAAASGDTGLHWVRAHRSELQIGGVALAVVVLLVFDISFVGLVVLGVLVAAGALLLNRITATPDASSPDATSPGPA